MIQHGGGIDGFNTFLAYYPDNKLTVAVLANLNGQTPTQIATKLADLAHGGVVQLTSERKEITLPAATLSKYVGTYELAPGVNMMIRLAGDRLTTQLTGQQQFPIFAESETKFFLKVVDAQVEFFTDASGAVTHAVMYQNGRERKVPRTSATVAEPPQHKETRVPASTLTRYVGTYQTPSNAELTVTLYGNQLMAQLTGQPAFPIFAESETLVLLQGRRSDAGIPAGRKRRRDRGSTAPGTDRLGRAQKIARQGFAPIGSPARLPRFGTSTRAWYTTVENLLPRSVRLGSWLSMNTMTRRASGSTL